MKVSDYFKGYVSKIYGDYLGNVCFMVEGQQIDVELDFDKCESAALHAINNHDRLTEENAKLREFVEMVAAGDSASDEAKSIMVHACIHNAKQLLNQLKEQNK